jgi:hypothetical protein
MTEPVALRLAVGHRLEYGLTVEGNLARHLTLTYSLWADD